jgi:hypothetical protein
VQAQAQAPEWAGKIQRALEAELRAAGFKTLAAWNDPWVVKGYAAIDGDTFSFSFESRSGPLERVVFTCPWNEGCRWDEAAIARETVQRIVRSRAVAAAAFDRGGPWRFMAAPQVSPAILDARQASGVAVLAQVGARGSGQSEWELKIDRAIEAALRGAGFVVVRAWGAPWTAKAWASIDGDRFTLSFESRTRPVERVELHCAWDAGCRWDEAEIASAVVAQLVRSRAVEAALAELSPRAQVAATAPPVPAPPPPVVPAHVTAAPTPAPGWLSVSAAAPVRKRLAVLELRGALEPSLLALVTDQVRSAALGVVRTHGVGVLTRENVSAVLKELGRSLACAEGDCEVETARNIGADLVVTGEVARVRGRYIVTLKLFDSASATLVSAQQAQASDELELVSAVKPAARALFE